MFQKNLILSTPASTSNTLLQPSLPFSWYTPTILSAVTIDSGTSKSTMGGVDRLHEVNLMGFWPFVWHNRATRVISTNFIVLCYRPKSRLLSPTQVDQPGQGLPGFSQIRLRVRPFKKKSTSRRRNSKDNSSLTKPRPYGDVLLVTSAIPLILCT